MESETPEDRFEFTQERRSRFDLAIAMDQSGCIPKKWQICRVKSPGPLRMPSGKYDLASVSVKTETVPPAVC